MVVAGLALLVAFGAGVPFVTLRIYSRRLRARDLGRVDKLHRLNKATALVGSICFAGVAAAVIAVVPDVAPRDRGPLLAALVFAGPYLAACCAVVGGSIAGIFPLYKELRELDQTARSAMGKGLRASLLIFLPLLLFAVGLSAVPGSVRHNPLAMWAVRLGFFFTLFAAAPIWAVRAFGRSDIDPELKKDLLDFCAARGFVPRDIRSIEGRQGKEANAMIVGVLPRHRYILITDYLIDEFTRDELKAVVAHELGHAREHHLLVFLGAFFAASLIGAAGQVLVAHLENTLAAVLGIVVMGGAIAAMFWAGWALWLRFEYRADAFSARETGVDATIAALEKLAKVNMVPRKTGRLWNALNRHPSIEQRVDRLREAHATAVDRRSERMARPGTAAR